jgi:SynChlorMet cassette radical SAM/SPASM protein ScmF
LNELPRQNRIDESRILETYPLETIYFYLTGDCNLACRHCWISPSHQKKAVSQSALDFPLFFTIIDEAKPLGLKSVKLTGGEPLIHPRIGEIMMFIRQENLRLIIESNGIALTSEIAALIADSKIPFISISLDGADAETHEWMRGVPGSFHKALTGIRTMVDAGVRPQIVMTLTKRNVHQIQTVIDLAEHEGAESVKINILLLIAR